MNARMFLFCASLVTVSTSMATADPVVARDDGGAGGALTEASTERSAAEGAFLPFTIPARNDAQRAYGWASTGYDSARGGLVVDSAVMASLIGPVGLRAGVGYVGPGGTVRPSVSLSVDVLRQERHGINLAVYGGYQGQGFNTVPALNVVLSVGRRFGRVNLLANVGYGYGLEAGEHYGELRLAGVVHAHRLLTVGVDARARLDLERDDDEPTNEPDWDLFAGPQATLTLGHVAVSANVGFSSLKYRLQSEVYAGALAQLSVGAAF